jgi:hypothetical protein
MYLQGFCIVAYLSPYKLHQEYATNRKFSPQRSNHSMYTPYTLNTLNRNKNILIHNSIYPVLQNMHYYILTLIHPHIHVGKTHRREHGDLLDIPEVVLHIFIPLKTVDFTFYNTN